MISARFLMREFFDYTPQFKPWVCLNHKPVVRGTDNGIWRRLCLIPFEVTFTEAEQDKGLRDKLRAEASGILKWALDGCGWWRAEGLNPPDAVKAATDAYRSEMDILKAWIEDCAETGPTAGPTPFRALYQSYVAWAKDNGQHPRASKWFAMRLDEKGIRQPERHGAVRTRLGIRLLAEQGTLADQWNRMGGGPTY